MGRCGSSSGYEFDCGMTGSEFDSPLGVWLFPFILTSFLSFFVSLSFFHSHTLTIARVSFLISPKRLFIHRLEKGQKADYLSSKQHCLILFVILTIESPETVVIRFNPRIMIRCQQIKESSRSSGFTSSSGQQLQLGQLCYDDDCTLALLIW